MQNSPDIVAGVDVGRDVIGNGRNGRDVSGNGNNVDTEDGNCLRLGGNGGKNVDEGDAFGSKKPTYGEKTARMPVEPFSTHYNMGHRNRGIALIFNHEEFECNGLRKRSGTDQDKKALESLTKSLGYHVRVFQDLTFNDIEQNLKQVAKLDHSNYDCLAVFVLTHGDTGIIYAKDMPYKPEYLWSKFTPETCPSLAGKPKKFFLQACQGDKLDGGITLVKTETDGHSPNAYRIPSQADFLIVYSTVKGYYSWRNTTRGSWFIQALCEELKKHAYTTDLLTILTFVSQRVALDYESNVPDNPSMHRQKQIPCVMSMLTRLVQFNQK